MNSSRIQVDKQDVVEVKIKRFSYVWKIKNFRFLIKQPGESVRSPNFTFGSKYKIDWHLQLFPNGNKKENEKYLSLYINWKSNNKIKGQFKVSLIDNKQRIKNKKKGDLKEKFTEKPTSVKGRGSSHFIERDIVLKEESRFLHNDCLTIHCEIILFLDKMNPVIENRKQKFKVNSRPSWFKKLFLEERLSDIKLISIPSDKSLPAHRNVLAACSPVFEAMFTHDMLEQKSGEVKIIDYGYDVIKEMLRFIYLGEVENFQLTVFELVKLADKYQITELIEFCERILMGQISVDNVLKVTALADSYNMERLKTRALDFGCLHLKEVINSNDFESLVYSQAMQSIIRAFGQR